MLEQAEIELSEADQTGNRTHLAHAGVSYAEDRLVQRLLEDELHGLGELLFRVDGKVVELGHQGVKLLGTELVEDGADLLSQSLHLVHSARILQ